MFYNRYINLGTNMLRGHTPKKGNDRHFPFWRWNWRFQSNKPISQTAFSFVSWISGLKLLGVLTNPGEHLILAKHVDAHTYQSENNSILSGFVTWDY